MENKKSVSTMKAFAYVSNNLVGSGMQVLNIISPDQFPVEEPIDENDVVEDMDDPFSGPTPMHRRRRKFKFLNKSKLSKLMEYLEFMSEYLHLDKIQTIALVSVISRQINSDAMTDVDDICCFLSIGAIEGMPFKRILENMESMGYLKITMGGFRGNGYSCPDDIVDCIVNNEEFKVPSVTAVDRYAFCAKVSKYIDVRSNDNLTTDKLFSKVRALEKKYGAKLEFVSKVKELLEDVVDRTFFYEMCDDITSSQRSFTCIESTVSDIFGNPSRRYRYANQLIKEQNAMFDQELVELKPSEMVNDSRITLSDKGKRLYFGEDYELFCNETKSDPSIVKSDSIKEVKLFYDDDFNKKAAPFRTAMVQENFQMLQERLSEKALPTGVAAIFYGAPGTGKTELVKQIARETGRTIMHVDISQTKSCWVGESEKMVKNIFVRYRKLCKQEKLKPILLFNEADAIFSKRMDASASHNASVVQMMNAMQNIILEEMETLDGILIATTNLHGNMDDAFSRRFLYKLEFNKPSKDAKVSIWKSKLPDLSDSDATTLAVRYDLSGGEIDNIVRKSLVEEVVSGKKADLETLCQFCEAEKFNKNGCRKVGY